MFTRVLFLDWYTNYFYNLLYHICKVNLPPKPIVLLEHVHGHPAHYGNVQKVNVFKCSPLLHIQPMGVGAKTTFKSNYLLESFRRMVSILDTNPDEMTVTDTVLNVRQVTEESFTQMPERSLELTSTFVIVCFGRFEGDGER